MNLFSVPPETQYDLNFRVAGVPVRVHPLFWVIALLIGGSGGLQYTLVLVFAFFISILVHELGHSLMMRRYGQDSFIILHGMGGLAVPVASHGFGGRRSVARTLMEQIYISLAGPFAGFLLAAIVCGIVFVLGGTVGTGTVLGFIPVPEAYLASAPPLVNSLIGILLWINVFWGLINLMPVFPLDGGQVARSLFIMGDPYDGVRKSLILSVATGALVAVGGLMFFNSIFMALLFGFLGFQSYQQLSGAGRY